MKNAILLGVCYRLCEMEALLSPEFYLCNSARGFELKFDRDSVERRKRTIGSRGELNSPPAQIPPPATQILLIQKNEGNE
jgi:hypothetical protein